MPSTSPAYWAFLSYSSRDRKSATWLQRALETYRVPRRLVGRETAVGPAPRQLRPIFRDRTELAADADLRARIQGALAQSGFLIVLCSPNSAGSNWVEEEIRRFRALNGAERILTVILETAPFGSLQNCFPPALRHDPEYSLDDPRPVPIAADLRPKGDGRRMAILKLVAGMLGVGLDDLVRRDNQRRIRRLVTATGAAVAGMAVMGILAVAAVIARNEAQRQRSQAEGLIEFMLTDLRKKLEASGRLNLMDGVGNEALNYYREQKPSSLDALSLAQRARALRLMGEIKIQRGDLDDALASFEQASATTEELLSRSPGDGQRMFDHAQNVFWVGEIARQRGNMETAEASFVRYRDLAQRLGAIDPTNDDWRVETAYAESAIGVLFLQEGRSAEAIGPFERSLSVAADLARRHPDTMNLQVEKGQGHAWLADALQKAGRLTEARAHRETELSVYHDVLQKDPTIRQAKFSRIAALQILGRLKQFSGDQKGALADFRTAVDAAAALLDEERDNMDVTSLLAIAQIDCGEALLSAGQLDEARAAQQAGAALLGKALAHDDTVTLWRINRDRATLLEAAVFLKSGNPEAALRLDRAVLDELGKNAGAASNTDPFWLLQRARLQTGDDYAAMRRTDEARNQWTDITRSFADRIDDYEPKLLILLEAADQRLGRSDAVHEIAKRLASLSREPGKG